MRRFVTVLIVSFLLTTPLPHITAAETDLPEIDTAELVKKVDEVYRGESSHAIASMAVKTPHWERTLKMEVWSRGMEDTFIRILAPPKEAGMATLKRGTEMWNYLPKVNKVMKVPPSMMMGAWMGSDLTNDDLVKAASLFEDYTYKQLEPQGGHYRLELTPKPDAPVTWGKILIEADRELLPTRQVFFDEDGEKVRVFEFKDVKQFDGRKMPAVMRVRPLDEDEAGNETVLTYEEAQFGVDLDDDVFSLRNLKSKR